MIIAVLLLLISTLTMYLPIPMLFITGNLLSFTEILKETTYQSLKHPCDVNEGYSSHTKDEKIITCIPISKLLFTQSLSTL